VGLAPPPTVFIMNTFSNNIVKRYQNLVQKENGYFPDEQQSELDLLTLTDFFLLFKPKSDE
jgi:choline-glycine betaine transporter